jgi:N-acetylmuramoyl-L-alanine amidase
MKFESVRQYLPLALVLSASCLFSVPASANPTTDDVAIQTEPVSAMLVASSDAAKAVLAAVPAPAPAKRTKTESSNANALRTRFVIGVEKSTDFQVFTLTNPTRVIVDMPDMKLRLPDEPQDKAGGLVSSFRAGASAPGRTRVVIETTSSVVVQSSKMEKSKDGKSQQLAIEIVQASSVSKSARKAMKSPPSALGASGLQPPTPLRAQRPDVKAAKTFKPTIVIDPGHGGHDTGAVKNGAVEKEVVLAFSKALKKKLEDSGRYKVVLTRDNDTFVPLDERLVIAERSKGSLFIAVHADYATTRARGATIYSLRDGMANSLKRSAKGEVSSNVLSSAEVTKVKTANDSDGDVSAVRNILSDLAQREVDATQERTSLFTRAVIENMGETTNMRDDPDQQAGFRVLKTAKFPSVLIELAYVTNKEDAEQLKSTSWRDKVSDSIKTAIDNYFSNQISRLPM